MHFLLFLALSLAVFGVLSFYHDAYATGGTVSDGPSCVAIGGSWDGGKYTCTMSSFTIYSGDQNSNPSNSGDVTITVHNPIINGPITV